MAFRIAPANHVNHSNPIDEESHLRIMRLIETQPAMSQRELAGALGISLGKANYLLKALVEKGTIKASNFRRSDNKLAYAYLLTPAGVAQKAALTSRFLRRKLAEYESLKREIEQLQDEVAGSDPELSGSNAAGIGK